MSRRLIFEFKFVYMLVEI